MRRGLLASAVVVASLSCAATASATTIGWPYFGSSLTVVGEPGQTNTIVWATDTSYTTGATVYITDATAPVRLVGVYPTACRKVVRTAICDDDAGLIDLGDGADTFTAPLNNNWGYESTCCYVPQFSVSGGAGNDRIFSSVQNDSAIDGGPGNDLIVQGTANVVHGGSGNDTIVILKPHIRSFGYSSFECGEGYDTIALPKGIPVPADCERTISLPQAISSIPRLPYLG